MLLRFCLLSLNLNAEVKKVFKIHVQETNSILCVFASTPAEGKQMTTITLHN